MKKIYLLFALEVFLVAGLRQACDSPAPSEEPFVLSEEDDWYSFVDAVAWKESSWNESAVGAGNDVGYLQITPVIIEDANRILGYEEYCLGDRYDKFRSIEIFDVIQNHYNPEHDKAKALAIWNRRAGNEYRTDILRMYEFLISDRQN